MVVENCVLFASLLLLRGQDVRLCNRFLFLLFNFGRRGEISILIVLERTIVVEWEAQRNNRVKKK